MQERQRLLRQISVFLLTLSGSMVAIAQENTSLTPTCWEKSPTMRVCYVERRTIPIVDIKVDITAGSTYDSPQKAGLAGLTRHMMTRGTHSMSEDTLLAAFDDIGADLGGSIEWDRASFTLRSLSEPAIGDRAVALLSDILKNPSFSEETLTREKARIIASLREELKSPRSVATKAYYRAIYPDHPYGYTSSIESVESIQRQDLIDFHQEYYGTDYMTVAIVGDIDRAQVEAIADKLDISNRVTKSHSIPSINPLPQSETIKRPVASKQSHILMGMPVMIKNDPDFFPLVVANQIFGGGGMLSRLMTEVREKRGLVYGINSSFQTAKEPGPFTIFFQVEGDKAQEALMLTQNLYRQFIDQGPTQTEVDQAKKYLASSLPLQFESNQAVLTITSTIAFYRLPETWVVDYPKKIEAVTLDQVNDALKRRLGQRPVITVIAGQE